MSNGKQVLYWEYLKLDKLLSLQTGIGGNDEVKSNDELHFIIVHQVYELWFKLLLNELTLIRDKMNSNFVPEETLPKIVHHLDRANEIMDLASKQFKLMETLIPQDFIKFRTKLGTASGFQSFQMREIELLLGLDEEERKKHGNKNPLEYILSTAENTVFGEKITQIIQNRIENKSIKEVVFEWLYRTPIFGITSNDEKDKENISSFVYRYIDSLRKTNEQQIQSLVIDGGDEKTTRDRFDKMVIETRDFLLASNISSNKREKISRIRVGLLFIESYRDLPLLAWPRKVIDSIIEFEERMVSFRFNHARMVERIIGRRIGTGGSDGVSYLDSTTNYRIFRELWAVRTIVLNRELLPYLDQPHKYGFYTEN